jgi:hypothetical protein
VLFRQISHIILAGWLAVTFLFGMTPKEFVHLFADHHDTVHCHTGEGLAFESEHHHCDFLCFTLPPFEDDHRLVIQLSEKAIPQPVHSVVPVLHLQDRSLPGTVSRGPPAC